ncbi:hypothetical protein EJ647_06075, partial [Pseudomonas aeruginosa]
MNGRRPSAASLAAPAALLGDIRALIEAGRHRPPPPREKERKKVIMGRRPPQHTPGVGQAPGRLRQGSSAH